jgi:thiol-disulfide isomerase/thioredoxin
MSRRTFLGTLLTLGLVACGAQQNAQPLQQSEQAGTGVSERQVVASETALSPTNQPPTSVPAEPTPLPPTAVPLPDGPVAPELEGGGAWINSEPLTLAGLRGKVVLVNFWTYGCFNCQNTLPHVKAWWDEYKDQGLVIVGVHTPEFESEKKLENVQAAVEREGLGWPVVQDNDKLIWSAYRNRFWPRFYLVDHRGQIVYDHIGEGAYDETARQIERALAAR